jgi:uncharacterized protein YktB (UPF0637 family)
MDSNLYTPIWNKYRPVILKLMSEAQEEPQHYKLFAHEFKAAGEKIKTSFSFTLEATKGKAINDIRKSMVAKDLLQVLQQSKTATQLMESAIYELKMDKQCVLSVNRKEQEVVEV